MKQPPKKKIGRKVQTEVHLKRSGVCEKKDKGTVHKHHILAEKILYPMRVWVSKYDTVMCVYSS